jgi:hypothetical protein
MMMIWIPGQAWNDSMAGCHSEQSEESHRFMKE